MFGKRYHLFTLLGFDIRLDASWFVLAFLVTWTLAMGYFPFALPGQTRGVYWAMGIAGTLGLFASIVLHETAHSVVARRNDIPMKGITLFIFGGVAEMDAEPPNGRAEFKMAIAGPIMSVVLGALLIGIGRIDFWPVALSEVVSYLGRLNFILAVFNMIPAFPLDGGRVLRALLWERRGNLESATRTASRAGAGFGIALMVLGIASVFLLGSLVIGIWWFVLGLFLRSLASASYQQVLLRQALEGESVRRFMRADPITVPPDVSVRDLVEDYVYKHHHKLYPVTSGESLSGCVTVDQVRKIPRDEWERKQVGEIAAGCTAENTIRPDADALEALKLMRRTGTSRLLVVSDGHLEGVLTLKDLLQFFALKVDLEG